MLEESGFGSCSAISRYIQRGDIAQIELRLYTLPSTRRRERDRPGGLRPPEGARAAHEPQHRWPELYDGQKEIPTSSGTITRFRYLMRSCRRLPTRSENRSNSNNIRKHELSDFCDAAEICRKCPKDQHQRSTKGGGTKIGTSSNLPGNPA